MTTSCSSSKRVSKKSFKNPCIECSSFKEGNESRYLASMKQKYKAADRYKKDHIIRDLYFKASELEDNYKLQESVLFFEALRTLVPEDSHLTKRYVLGLIKNGSVEKALEELESLSALKLDSDNRLDLAHLRANVHESMGNMKIASDIYDEILKQHPQDADVCLKRSFLEMESSTDGAISILSKCHQAMRRVEDKSEMSFKIGRLFLDLGNLKESEKYFSRAYKEFPENSKSLAALGVILAETQRADRAIKKFKNHLRYIPDDYLISKRLMDHYVSKENYELAVPYMEKMVDLNPKDPAVKFKLAYLYRELNAFDKSIEAINEVLPFGIENDKSYFFLGDLYIQKKDFSKAVSSFDKIKPKSTYYNEGKMRQVNLLRDLALTPNREIASNISHEKKYLLAIKKIKKESDHLNFDLDMNRAIYWKRKSEFSKVISILKKLEKNKSFGRDHKFFLASMYEKINDTSSSDGIILKMIKDDPSNAQAYNYIGYSYIERKEQDLDQAKVYLEKALSLTPNDAHILDSVGWYYYHKKEYKKSLEYLLQAYSLGLSKDFTVNKHIGLSYQKLGNASKAKEFFKNSLTHATSESEKSEIEQIQKSLSQKMPASL